MKLHKVGKAASVYLKAYNHTVEQNEKEGKDDDPVVAGVDALAAREYLPQIYVTDADGKVSIDKAKMAAVVERFQQDKWLDRRPRRIPAGDRSEPKRQALGIVAQHWVKLLKAVRVVGRVRYKCEHLARRNIQHDGGAAGRLRHTLDDFAEQLI